MVLGMATTKITVTLRNEEVAAIRKLVATGKTKNVSAFVQHAVTVSLADVAGWGAMLALALEESGGPLTRKEREWADSVLKPQAKPRRKRRAA
jgi:Arc/MetJ-type ribon-helix-helix transcriptional regulator